MRVVLATALACGWLLACGKRDTAPAGALPPTTAQAVVAEPQAASPLYDAAGNLLPSDKHVAWLELPRGLSEVPGGLAHHHVYRAEGIPIDRIQAFFGARIIAHQLEKLNGTGQRFIGGTPPEGMKPKQGPVDIDVIPSVGNAVSISIDEHPFMPVAASFNSSDARSLLKEEQKHAE